MLIFVDYKNDFLFWQKCFFFNFFFWVKICGKTIAKANKIFCWMFLGNIWERNVLGDRQFHGELGNQLKSHCYCLHFFFVAILIVFKWFFFVCCKQQKICSRTLVQKLYKLKCNALPPLNKTTKNCELAWHNLWCICVFA